MYLRLLKMFFECLLQLRIMCGGSHLGQRSHQLPLGVEEILAIFCSSSLAVRTVNSPPRCSTSIQGLNCDDPDRKDLLMDIGTEELSHLAGPLMRCNSS
jgi:hypothetical protein